MFLVSEGPNIMAHILLFHVALEKPNHDSKAGRAMNTTWEYSELGNFKKWIDSSKQVQYQKYR